MTVELTFPKVGSLSKCLEKCSERDRKWYTNDFVSECSPIVVGGCGRSGTSLLRAMLDNHRNIVGGPESYLLLPLLPEEDYIPGVPPTWIYQVAWIFKIDADKSVEMWQQSTCQVEFTDLFFAYQQQLEGKTRWCEKTPRNVTNLDWIFKHWPNARFIHVVRDGRDVVCSLKEHPKWKWQDGKRVRRCEGSSPFDGCINRWFNDTRAGLAWRTDYRYHEIRYEDLVMAPSKILRKALSWLKEPWDPDVLQYYKKPRDPDRDIQAPGIEKPLFTSAIGRWRKDLSPSEVQTFKDHKAGQLLVDLGYASGMSWR